MSRALKKLRALISAKGEANTNQEVKMSQDSQNPRGFWSCLRWLMIAGLSSYCIVATAKGLHSWMGMPLVLCHLASLAFYASAVLFLHVQPDKTEEDGGGVYRLLGYVITISLTIATAAIGTYQFNAPRLAAARDEAEIQRQWQTAQADLAAFGRAVLEKISQRLDIVNRDIPQERQRLRALRLSGQPADRSRLTALEQESQLLLQARAIFSHTASSSNASRLSSSHRTGVRYPQLEAVPPAEVREARNQLARAFDQGNEAYAVLPVQIREGLTPPALPEATINMRGSLNDFIKDTLARDPNAVRAWAVPAVLELLILCLVRFDRKRTRRLDQRIVDARAWLKALWWSLFRTPVTLQDSTIRYRTVSVDPEIPSHSGAIILGSDQPLMPDDVRAHSTEIVNALSKRLGTPVRLVNLSRADGQALDASRPLGPQLDGDDLRLHIEPVEPFQEMNYDD